MAEEWMLAIDTSSEVVSLALAPVSADWGAAGGELTWQAGRNQTATLLEQIDRLCRLCGVESAAFGALAVATGPGSFNALRVGMSVAKGFAFALDIPIVGIGTLDVTAQSVVVAGCERPVRACVAAGRGRVVSADYEWRDGRLRPRGDMCSRLAGELDAGLNAPTVLAGEVPEAEAARLRANHNVILPTPASRRRRAGVLLDLAARRWREGEWDDLVTLEPMYVHATRQAGAPEPATEPGTTV